MEISPLPRRRRRFQWNEEVEIPEVGWSRGGIAHEVWHDIRDTIAANSSLSLFSVPFYQKETQMFARPSLLQFNRDETCPDCKLSGYSVAGLNAYDCSPLIARLVNSRTNGLEMREISISQFCPQNGMFCEIVDTFVLLFWKIFQNIYIHKYTQVIFKDHFE